jgi:hypothetical protein
MQSRVAEIVFWFHVVLVICVVSSGFWLSFWIVTFIMVLHRAHFFLFKGCILSRLQEKIEPFPNDMCFLQYAWFRITGIRIDAKQKRLLDVALICTPIVVSLLK